MVTPYWPPVNRVGVWRVLRTARYLPKHGWTPTICTPISEQVYRSDIQQDSSFSPPPFEVIQPHTFIPSMATARLLARPNRWLQAHSSRVWPASLKQLAQLIDQGSFRLIAELLLPDQFVEWGIQVARQFKKGELKASQDIDVVWVTGGPFGFFVAGVLIAEALNKPLVLDYRDPWTTHRSPRSWWIAPPQSLFRQIEAWALSKAKAVGYIHREALIANRAAFGQKPTALWTVITNSFDPIDLGDLPPRYLSKECSAPALVYAGHFYDERSAVPIIKALIQLEKEDPDSKAYPLTLHVFGQLDQPSQRLLKEQPLPTSRFTLYPRHSSKEIGAIMRGAEALLLVIGEGGGHSIALSGKIWDYLATGSPILGLGPQIASAKNLIKQQQLGVWVDSADLKGLVEQLKIISTQGLPRPQPKDLQPFHAKEMSKKIAQLLDHALASDTQDF